MHNLITEKDSELLAVIPEKTVHRGDSSPQTSSSGYDTQMWRVSPSITWCTGMS